MARETCLKCFRIQSLCLCKAIHYFEIEPLIVLLVHPREFMKTVGTVRIVKLSVSNSVMLRGRGSDFDQDSQFLSLISNPDHHPMILFPGSDSLNLNSADSSMLAEKIPTGKRLVIFVIDGTWTTAKQIIRDSKILRTLPKISFDVGAASVYEFRKQPKQFCLSTVEAVALLIENLKEKGLCLPTPENGHQKMIQGFKLLIEAQLHFEANPKHRPAKRYRRARVT